MDDQSKNNSINKDSNGDKTKIVKTQKEKIQTTRWAI